MKSAFYPAILLLAALPACGGDAADGDPAPSQEISVFALPAGSRATWSDPGADGWVARWVEHLRIGSKEQIRFAKQRLRELDDAARPALEAELRAGMHESRNFGHLISACEVLGGVGDAASAALLLETAAANPTAVVRTTAFEAIGRIAPEDEDLARELVALLARIPDQAPRGAAMGALATIGTADAIAELERLVGLWLAGAPGTDGQVAYSALLASPSPLLSAALARLEPRLPAYPQLQAIAVRAKLGESCDQELVRGFLDPTLYPSASTRELALGVLAEVGDWETVLAARDDPNPAVQQSVVGLLRRPDARDAGIGEDLLDLWVESENPDLKFNALLALVERGQRNRLDPWLRQLQGFPTAPGSMQALAMFSKPELRDPRTTGILISRWPYADGPGRLDLLGALVRADTAEAARFIADVAMDQEEAQPVRDKAATVLANFESDAVDLLLEVWRAEPTPDMARWVVPGLGRYADDPRVTEFLRTLAGDAAVPDVVRREVIDLLPRILGGEALPVLLALRDAEPRAEIRSYLDALLVGYF